MKKFFIGYFFVFALIGCKTHHGFVDVVDDKRVSESAGVTVQASADTTSASIHAESYDDGETDVTIVEDITYDEEGRKTSEHRETKIRDKRNGKTIADMTASLASKAMQLCDTTRRDLSQFGSYKEETKSRPSANTSIFGLVILLGLILAVFIAYKFFLK